MRGDPVHGLGQFHVARGHPTGVMGGEDDLDRFVDIAPFRVVVAFFSHQSRAAHEAERLIEILEHKGAFDRLSARATSFQPGKPFSADFRASADSRSVTIASMAPSNRYLTPNRSATIRKKRPPALKKALLDQPDEPVNRAGGPGMAEVTG